MRDLMNIVEDLSAVDLTQTPEFKAWFGNSKAIDGDGQPMVCHHFTYNDFAVFDRLWAANKFNRDPESIDRVGIWFTSNPNAKYAGDSMGGKRMDCFVSIQKPLWLDDEPGKEAWVQLNDMVTQAGGATNLRARLKAQGYDGIIMTGTKLDMWEQHVFIAFEPNQIKSVANKGTFDPSNPSIYEGEEDQPQMDVMGPREFGQFIRSTPENADVTKRLKYLNDIPNEDHIVIMIGNKIVAVGGVQLNPYYPIQLWIKHISVDPAYQGRGFARRILERIYQLAAERGMKVKHGSFTEEGERLKHIHDELEARYPHASFSKDTFGRYVDDEGRFLS